jgi:hypothetical protein
MVLKLKKNNELILYMIIFLFGIFIASIFFFEVFMRTDVEKVSMLTDALVNFNNDSNTEFARNYINENMTIRELGDYCDAHIGKCQYAIGLLIAGVCGVR